MYKQQHITHTLALLVCTFFSIFFIENVQAQTYPVQTNVYTSSPYGNLKLSSTLAGTQGAPLPDNSFNPRELNDKLAVVTVKNWRMYLDEKSRKDIVKWKNGKTKIY